MGTQTVLLADGQMVELPKREPDYFERRYLAGERPNYALPVATLPQVNPDFTLKVETIFMQARRADK